MRRNPDTPSRHAGPLPAVPGDWGTIKGLLPYLWDFRGRVALALGSLFIAKLANVGVPLVLKQIVDALGETGAPLVLPTLLLIGYGLLRLSSTLFAELRDIVFAKVAQRSIRNVALKTFRHLHSLSLRFHLERQTGGVSRDIERGTRGIDSLLRYAVFSIIPTLFEMALVGAVLITQYSIGFAVITLGALTVYVTLTIVITEWRTHFRRTMNELDSRANTRAIDSLINYETVKYFNNEDFETRRYDESLRRWEQAAIKSQVSLGLLNVTQALLIASAVTALMVLAADGVVSGAMTVGDLVMVNVLLMQLYIPLNFLGVIYREIKQSLADTEKMFRLLAEHKEVDDGPAARPLLLGGAAIRLEHVDFHYDANRQILFDVSFEVPAGHKVAVVGTSGAGKSTLARLLFRYYDISGGRIVIDSQEIRDVTQASLRKAIGIVPQDTVLFNDTIGYNIAYGRPDASAEEVVAAAKSAHIYAFVQSLPDKFETLVGERGLKLSGGERQRVAIARTLLKDPAILIFDEATSALDSHTEKIIQAELERIAEDRTTLVIAHRLSTVIDADQILVMEAGRIVERGSHRQLLERGEVYARMWALQQEEEAKHAAEPPAPGRLAAV
ncbi:MAG: ABCB family ABC transporter ATP-binding protein/permease [Gammaproteobacteria bacterium]